MELGVNIGTELLQAQRDSNDQKKRTEVADLMAYLAIDAASRIAERTGDVNRISLNDFSANAALIMGRLMCFFREVSGISIETSELSIDPVQACENALNDLNQEASRVSVTQAIVKQN